ncbi:hypothetical protein FQZ97_1177620 [compost metagenome]
MWIAHPLFGQAQGAAARQAEARRFFTGDAIGDQLHRRTVRRNATVVQPGDQVILDTTARHRTDHHAIFAQGQHRPRRPWRGAPGLDHGEQHHPLPGAAPLKHAAQDIQINAVHQAFACCQPCS